MNPLAYAAEAQRLAAKEFVQCMGYTRQGHRCTRRYTYGKMEGGRVVYCTTHARQAGWRLW